VLVFTRKRHERIMIGDGIQVEVLRVGRDGVRLGVIAPPDVAVHRSEIYEQIREANQKAAQPNAAEAFREAGTPHDFSDLARKLLKRA
jgi:carbon storage regulator